MIPISIVFSTFLTSTAEAKEIIPKADPYALIHVWATLYDQDESVTADPGGYGDPEDDIGFKLRRARAGVVGANDFLKYTVVVGMSSPYDQVSGSGSSDIGLLDANLALKPLYEKDLLMTIGTQKIPVSREQIMSSSDLVLAERAASSIWMVPDRDTGILLSYGIDKDSINTNIEAGVYNGNQSILGNDNGGLLVASRAEVVYGDADVYKTYGMVDGVTVGAAGDFYLNNDVATQTMGYGGDLLLRVKGAAVLAEFRSATITPTNSDLDVPSVFSETAQMGYLVQAGYTVAEYEMAVRYSTFDDNTAQENAGDVSALSAGVTWHEMNDLFHTGIGYEMRIENGSDSIANDTLRMWVRFQY